MLESVLKSTEFSQILKGDEVDFTPIDISLNNTELMKIDVANPAHFSDYINNYIQSKNAKIAYGGYNEERNIYRRSETFNSSESDERFIHLGVDLWTKAYTPIYAPLKGKVHSFNDNFGLGNYGPTIILEHKLKGNIFYTLYGHLTKDSLHNLKIGEPISKSEMFAAIGDFPNNGDYPSHLHFQIIKDLNGMKGDFPGVTSIKNRPLDLANCPNPNLILKKG